MKETEFPSEWNDRGQRSPAGRIPAEWPGRRGAAVPLALDETNNEALRADPKKQMKMLMKNKTWWLISAMALGVAGCIPSLNPLYTEKDLVFDAALVGSWGEKDSADLWTFEKEDSQSYKLTISDQGKTSPFTAHLVRLGQHRFLDLYPAKGGLDDFKGADFYKIALIRGHLIFKVTQIEPTLRLSFLDPDWFKKLLEKNPQALAHQQTGDDQGLITASTAELQKFMVENVNTEGAWSDASEMKRQHPAK